MDQLVAFACANAHIASVCVQIVRTPEAEFNAEEGTRVLDDAVHVVKVDPPVNCGAQPVGILNVLTGFPLQLLFAGNVLTIIVLVDVSQARILMFKPLTSQTSSVSADIMPFTSSPVHWEEEYERKRRYM